MRQMSLVEILAPFAALSLFASAAACSSTPKENEPETTATPDTTAVPTTEATSAPTAEPTTQPSASASTPPASTTPPSSGRPPMTSEGKEKVSGTFGATPAAKLTITTDSSVFRIPEYALGDGINITFMLDKKPPKKAKGGAGNVWRVQAQKPPAEETTLVTSNGPKFILRLPTAKVGSPNLAVGEIGKDDKGKETVTWKVVAPAKTEEGFATFEIAEIGNTLLQITSEAPQ